MHHSGLEMELEQPEGYCDSGRAGRLEQDEHTAIDVPDLLHGRSSISKIN